MIMLSFENKDKYISLLYFYKLMINGKRILIFKDFFNFVCMSVLAACIYRKPDEVLDSLVMEIANGPEPLYGC